MIEKPEQGVASNEARVGIEARIYDQEGKLQPITVSCPHFAEWLRVHDRYTSHATEKE